MEFQEYLSLGYIYLLVIGLLTDVMQFNYLNINILNYSNFLDILITPIKHLTSNTILPTFLGGAYLLVYLYLRYIAPSLGKEKNVFSVEKLLVSYALVTLGLFFGLGLGMGVKSKEMLEKGEFKPNYTIIFKDNKTLKVKVLEQNSTYIFYVPEKEKRVFITPVADNIFQLIKLPAK